MAYSPDGKTLASASKDKSIKLWDLAARKEKATLKGHGGAVLSLAYQRRRGNISFIGFGLDSKNVEGENQQSRIAHSLATKNPTFMQPSVPTTTWWFRQATRTVQSSLGGEIRPNQGHP